MYKYLVDVDDFFLKNLSTSTKIPFHLPVEVGRWDGDVH